MYLVAACSRLNHSTYLVLLGLLLCVLSPYLYCLNERHSKEKKRTRKGSKIYHYVCCSRASKNTHWRNSSSIVDEANCFCNVLSGSSNDKYSKRKFPRLPASPTVGPQWKNAWMHKCLSFLYFNGSLIISSHDGREGFASCTNSHHGFSQTCNRLRMGKGTAKNGTLENRIRYTSVQIVAPCRWSAWLH